MSPPLEEKRSGSVGSNPPEGSRHDLIVARKKKPNGIVVWLKR